MTLLSVESRLGKPHHYSSLNPAQRVFAIGDVHGRFDLFRRLINIVARDSQARRIVSTRVVLLGNIIDYGPDAARMIRGCMQLTTSTSDFVVLRGNHEDMMAEALGGNLTVYGHWLDFFGGRETLLSWGIESKVANGPATMGNLAAAAKAVGEDVIGWLANLPLYYQHERYLLVHAGIRPGIEINDQDPDDLMWIKNDFLNSSVLHEHIVVHGHAAVENGPVFRSNRIGIDTAAYRTGRLTALGIENKETWVLCTAEEDLRSKPPQ
ncbi:metallophosphoesterase [Sphingomonas sp. BAUL-RG-20F-R05-02]|uniref:metallophosphoesterase n=1 Tax=Sphingomonas sp. BAUL-RG-20F-R05-02 TaxID=2914830 RepID=UPI001F57D6BF|nr:metallophosphoesterase [Sphingomonas sp. BAUL-RG-20F-R05-02]